MGVIETCDGCRYVTEQPSYMSPCNSCRTGEGRRLFYEPAEPEKKAEKQLENLDQEEFMAWAKKVLDNMLAKEKNNILAIISRAWKQGTLHPKSEAVMDTIREALERSAVGGDKHEP